MKKRILSLILALSMVLSVLPLGAFAEGSNQELVMEGGFPKDSNGGTISCYGTGWTYSKIVTSYPTGKLTLTSGEFKFSSTAPVECAIHLNGRDAKITGGTFKGTVTNTYGTISDGTFNGKVTNYLHRTISGGTFKGTVNNNYGTISGGTFAAGLSKNNGSKILGGIFNGNANLTGAYYVTVTDGSVSQVNGEGPLNADGTPDTAWDLYSYKDTTMTITASTEIFSLNGKSIGDGNCNSSYGSDKTIVTFTMPGDNVVLNGAIASGDLVMENGWPKDSNGGKISCSGTDWSYDHITKTLTLTSGEYDFSSTEPVQCAIQSSATITGGTFEKKVTNNAGGTISGGTFQDTCSVTNNGTIKNGTFKNACSVTNNSTIENGTFKNMCRVINNKP